MSVAIDIERMEWLRSLKEGDEVIRVPGVPVPIYKEQPHD